MKRHALFVGVDLYADGHIPDLSCAVSDATDLHGFFKYGAGYDRVVLLQNPAGKKDVLGAVRELTAGLGSGDFFLFFFAGHGFRVGENHVLVCAKDDYEDVKYEDDGLPLGQLKRRLSGAFDCALFLDACQSDILATRGGEGIAERDLSLILEDVPRTDCSNGALAVVTSCDAGQTAAELSEARHGLFTMAMLDMLKEAQGAHTRLELSDNFRMNLGQRMKQIAADSRLSTEQRPRFSCTGDSCLVILDGIAPTYVSLQAVPPKVNSATYVSCPICGRHNLITDTFRCKVCGRDHLCLSHFSKDHASCDKCVETIVAQQQDENRKLIEKAIDCARGRNGEKQDVGEAVKYLRRAAEQGSAEAQFYLGSHYYQGLGVTQNYSEAVKWFHKAADQGYAAAQSGLGDCYANGEGVAQSYSEAVKWYLKAAEQENATAQFNLGVFYEKGRGVEQSYSDAVRWYRKAAEQGFSNAQFNLGGFYANGRGVEQSYTEAAKWYRQAAEQGYVLAQHNLGVYCEVGRGVEQNYSEAVKWYRRAAEQGFVGAQCNLGVCYNSGRGVEQSYSEAAKWYRRAAEQGLATAQFFLGTCYEDGDGVEQSYSEAAKWYLKAAEQGDADAQNRLGVCYEDGLGVEQSWEEAVKWYRRSAEQGNAIAPANLGRLYANGRGVEQSYSEAVKWYLKAAEQNVDVYDELVACYEDLHRYSEAVTLHRKVAELGDLTAQHKLGECYYYGRGVEQSYSEAVKWYSKAAEQGSPDALNNLGVCYANGLGVAKNESEAAKLYRQAITSGSVEAKCRLAELALEGAEIGVGQLEAGNLLREAYDQGSKEAAELAKRYFGRIGAWMLRHHL